MIKEQPNPQVWVRFINCGEPEGISDARQSEIFRAVKKGYAIPQSWGIDTTLEDGKVVVRVSTNKRTQP